MKGRSLLSTVITVILFVLAFITIVPFIWMLVSSFATNSAIVDVSGGVFPKMSTLSNYFNIQSHFDFLRFFMNSLFVSVVKTGVIIYSSAAFGYMFSKMRFRGRRVLFGIVLSTMMVPWAVTIIPQYEMMSDWGWMDTYRSLIVPGLVSAFGIFMFKQAIGGISDEIIEAARIDGAGDSRIFHLIVLPMSKNSISALAIFQFLWCWEDYLWPFLMVTDPGKQVLAVGLKMFNSQFGTDYGGLFAATSIAIIPVLIVYLIFQKQFIAGVASGSGK